MEVKNPVLVTFNSPVFTFFRYAIQVFHFFGFPCDDFRGPRYRNYA